MGVPLTFCGRREAVEQAETGIHRDASDLDQLTIGNIHTDPSVNSYVWYVMVSASSVTATIGIVVVVVSVVSVVDGELDDEALGGGGGDVDDWLPLG